jgi:hypothetical protein
MQTPLDSAQRASACTSVSAFGQPVYLCSTIRAHTQAVTGYEVCGGGDTGIWPKAFNSAELASEHASMKGSYPKQALQQQDNNVQCA